MQGTGSELLERKTFKGLVESIVHPWPNKCVGLYRWLLTGDQPITKEL
jgi:hypothetical protein